MDQFIFNPPVRVSASAGSSIASGDDAITLVRNHAIETGDGDSIRLVRKLKDAGTPDEIESAAAAFRRWARIYQSASS
jgi:hypothetical protein